jgi:hypothetical protein
MKNPVAVMLVLVACACSSECAGDNAEPQNGRVPAPIHSANVHNLSLNSATSARSPRQSDLGPQKAERPSSAAAPPPPSPSVTRPGRWGCQKPSVVSLKRRHRSKVGTDCLGWYGTVWTMVRSDGTEDESLAKSAVRQNAMFRAAVLDDDIPVNRRCERTSHQVECVPVWVSSVLVSVSCNHVQSHHADWYSYKGFNYLGCNGGEWFGMVELCEQDNACLRRLTGLVKIAFLVKSPGHETLLPVAQVVEWDFVVVHEGLEFKLYDSMPGFKSDGAWVVVTWSELGAVLGGRDLYEFVRAEVAHTGKRGVRLQ